MTPEAEQNIPNNEPTMEEILASIRKIIASDKPEEPVAPAANDEILELTDIVQEQTPEPMPEPEPLPPPPPVVEEPAMPAESVAPPEPPAMELPAADSLLSDAAAAASASVLADLERRMRQEQTPVLPPQMALGDMQQTLEGMVAALLRPMLKDWLDQNLPGMVERMVQREIERIVKTYQR